MRALKPKLWQASLLAGLFFALAACAGQQAVGDTTATPLFDIEDLLVYVPAGSFYMGSDADADPLARADEFPLHIVRLDGFFIYRNEVTNDMYAQCVAAGQCSPPTEVDEDGPSHHYGEEAYKANPVVGVDWDQAVAFCTWAAGRLPTEAEWEKTARGEFGDLYPWGNDDPSCDLSNMEGCLPEPGTDQIGQYPDGQSAYKADDMAGNVWEWMGDTYSPDYYGLSPSVNPLGPESGELKVVRGGSFMDGPVDLRSAARLGLDPDKAYNDVGFRCVPIGENNAAAVPPFCPISNTTAQGTPTGQAGYDFTGFGCPSEGLVSITIQGDGSPADSVEITVNGIVFTCVDSTLVPGRWVCTGSPPPMGTFATISVCPAQGASLDTSLVSIVPSQLNGQVAGIQSFVPQEQPGNPALLSAALQPSVPNQLVAYSPPQQSQAGLISFQPNNGPSAPQLQAFNQGTTDGFCPDGYTYNPDTLLCETNPGEISCPDGWTLNRQTYQCEPTEESCPEGTTYRAANLGCTPDDGQVCPDGYRFAADTNTCQPTGPYDETNACIPQGEESCSTGFYYEPRLAACVPYPDGESCPEGYYYEEQLQTCLPEGGGTPGEQGCVTFTESVPVCGFTPEPTPVCEKGTSYVPATRQCERNDQATQVACTSYNTQNSCVAAGCTWTISTTSYCH